jgi:dihydrofolate synthase/folylpolyglutamate synthase
MTALLADLGNPQLAFPSVVVAGTKGKGSSCAMIESIVRAAGYRTGLFTSPHLNSYRERVQVNRQPIGQAELAALVQRMVPVVERFDAATHGKPTTFELGFALAMCHFAATKIEFGVLEIGLGGRYDAVNVVTPLVSAISSISYDHMHVLGHTLAEIADNKAGIMKPGVPCISVPQQPEAAATLAQVAAEVGTPLWLADEFWILDFGFWNDERNPKSKIQNPKWEYPVPPVPALLRGPFQRENARLALGVALLLRERGLTLPDAALAQGLATANWPGRLELVAEQPFVVLDGAHNGDSAQKLLAALRSEFQFERLLLVLGTSRDKDIERIVAALVPAADVLILSRARHHRAQSDMDVLVAAARPFLRGELHITTGLPEALAQARRLARLSDLICVTGSLFVVGDAREAMGLAESD